MAELDLKTNEMNNCSAGWHGQRPKRVVHGTASASRSEAFPAGFTPPENIPAVQNHLSSSTESPPTKSLAAETPATYPLDHAH